MVINPVTSQVPISNAGELTSRAISADTIKIPEPIIDPITRVVALVSPSPFTSSGAAEDLDGVVWTSADEDILSVCFTPKCQEKPQLLLPGTQERQRSPPRSLRRHPDPGSSL